MSNTVDILETVQRVVCSRIRKHPYAHLHTPMCTHSHTLTRTHPHAHTHSQLSLSSYKCNVTVEGTLDIDLNDLSTCLLFTMTREQYNLIIKISTIIPMSTRRQHQQLMMRAKGSITEHLINEVDATLCHLLFPQNLWRQYGVSRV